MQGTIGWAVGRLGHDVKLARVKNLIASTVADKLIHNT